jgi:deferrochelatase/peroxidase EfeB
MTHALVTIICPLAAARLAEAETAIAGLGNPARRDFCDALDKFEPDSPNRTHFASLHAVRSIGGGAPYLLFEFSADGTEEDAVARIAAAGEAFLRPVFALAPDWRDGGAFKDYLLNHRMTSGGGWFDNPGVGFAGTPGMSVGRIRSEAALARRITVLLAAQPGHLTALRRVDDVGDALKNDPVFASALSPAIPEEIYLAPSTIEAVGKIGFNFVTTYLPAVVLLIVLWAGVRGYWVAQPSATIADGIGNFVGGALWGLWQGFWTALLSLLAIAGLTYYLFRKQEDLDSTDDRAADRAINEAIFARENVLAQNHMISITRRKPGAIRSFTSRLVFWGLGQLVGYVFAPGRLGDIGTIHFARWVTPPGTRDVVFLSNYDGSWESYLEDFITRAHAGLTAVWSNTIGFPRTENLLEKGATDGERFKRFARRSMAPTLFWYSAYPDLTTTAIRANAQIRRGLSGAMTEDEANAWLALFGSAGRPVSKLVSSEIQSLIFGGLGFLPAGVCLIYDLPEEVSRTKQWLAAIEPHIAFNDGRRFRGEIARDGQEAAADAVITLALGAGGLGKLGLSAAALATFPYAFLEGMIGPARARILGDIGENDPQHWRWGKRQPDAALLVYGKDEAAVAHLEAELADYARKAGMAPAHRITLRTLTPDKKEPFGFVDGISQPAIRGTYKGLRNVDPIHLIEPGEFILGYPDNRENMPPGPTLPAIEDPLNLLPLTVPVESGAGQTVVNSPRDLGFNGSFLVIRELEQDVEGFEKFCETEAASLRQADRLSPPYYVDKEFIAAKIVGRWRDGSSLARFPYESETLEFARRAPEDRYAHETARPISNPAHGATPVSRPTQRSPKGDNDFLFGTEDSEGMRCPFGAHIRRANPRDSLDPGSADQIAISNRHRIIRVGRPYQPAPGMKNPGLLFMCLNGDIERQFEFLQQTWLRSPSFHGLSCEKDPLLGDAQKDMCGFTIPSREGPVRLGAVPQFVATRGGGYFFVPGKRLIDYLCR